MFYNLTESFNACILINTLYDLERNKKIIDTKQEPDLPFEIFTNEIIPHIDSLEAISAMSRCCRLFHQTIKPNEIQELFQEMKPSIRALSNDFNPKYFFKKGYGRFEHTEPPGLKSVFSSIKRSISFIFMKTLFISDATLDDREEVTFYQGDEPKLPSNYKLISSSRIYGMVPFKQFLNIYSSDVYKNERTVYLLKGFTVIPIGKDQKALSLTENIALNTFIQIMNQIIKEKITFYLNTPLEMPVNSDNENIQRKMLHCARYQDYPNTSSSSENKFFIRRFCTNSLSRNNPFIKVEFENKEQFDQYLKDQGCEGNFYQDQLFDSNNKSEK